MNDATLPPGPRWPAALQGAWMAHRPFRTLERCRDRFGESFTLSLPRMGRVPIFSRPEEIERIFELDGRSLHGGAAQSPLVEFAGDGSLMKLDGAPHREHRAILAQALRPSELPGGATGVFERVREAVAGWPVVGRFDLGRAIDRLALELVAELALGGSEPELVAKGTRTMEIVRQSSCPFGLIKRALAPAGRSDFASIRGEAESYLDQRIDREPREGARPSKCIFARLMAGGPASGPRLAALEVRDEAMTVLAAMVAGLSCAIKHAFYWIIRTPGVQANLRASATGPASEMRPESIMRRPYLDAVCKEVLRYCPDIPFAVRKASEDVEIGGWKIPAGTTLGIGIYLAHRRAASFSDPERFQPGRFLDATPSRFEYLPFGGGRRGCVGAALFTFLQKMILASAFDRLEFIPCSRRANPATSLAIVSSLSRPLIVTARAA